MKHLLEIAVVLGIASIANAAFGAANSGTLTVTATIANECMVGTSSLSFGAYSFVNANAAVNSAGTIKVTCTSGSVPWVALGAATQDYGQRSMTSGVNRQMRTLKVLAGALVPAMREPPSFKRPMK